ELLAGDDNGEKLANGHVSNSGRLGGVSKSVWQSGRIGRPGATGELIDIDDLGGLAGDDRGAEEFDAFLAHARRDLGPDDIDDAREDDAERTARRVENQRRARAALGQRATGVVDRLERHE